MTKPIAKVFLLANILRFESLMDSTQDLFFSILDSKFAEPHKPCPIDDWLLYGIRLST